MLSASKAVLKCYIGIDLYSLLPAQESSVDARKMATNIIALLTNYTYWEKRYRYSIAR